MINQWAWGRQADDDKGGLIGDDGDCYGLDHTPENPPVEARPPAAHMGPCLETGPLTRRSNEVTGVDSDPGGLVSL